jgi:hypothetical protein
MKTPSAEEHPNLVTALTADIVAYEEENRQLLSINAATSAIASIPASLFWLIGKGRTSPTEPLYAVQLIDPESGVAIVETEGEELAGTINAAVEQLINSRRPEGER